MFRKIAFVPLLLAIFGLSGIADEPFPDRDIQWIFDQYHVSDPVSLVPTEGLNGWTWHNGKEITQSRWSNQGGKLVLERADKSRYIIDDDLVFAKQYNNFILDFAWIASEGANSGIKYRIKDYGKWGQNVISKTIGWLGCEYQILDDDNDSEGSAEEGRKSAASLYNIFAPDKETKRLNPHGQVNTGRIIALDNHIEHWLNGKKVLQYEIGSGEWKEAIENSKFVKPDAKAEGFGENPAGFIMLQNHGEAVTLEKIVIREINVRKD